MFERVLIAEDHESVSTSVKQTLKDLGMANPEYVSYCDHALVWIKKGVRTSRPYDLFITDLSFEEDDHAQEITDGVALIKAAKEVQPDLKILVFSAEGRPEVIKPLIRELGIHAYVRKARHDANELRAALTAISKGESHFPAQLSQGTKQNNSFSFTKYDTTIITLLAQGKKQKDIPFYLEANNIKPSGLSSIEKRLNLIKYVFDFTTNEQLIAYCKDYKII